MSYLGEPLPDGAVLGLGSKYIGGAAFKGESLAPSQEVFREKIGKLGLEVATLPYGNSKFQPFSVEPEVTNVTVADVKQACSALGATGVVLFGSTGGIPESSIGGLAGGQEIEDQWSGFWDWAKTWGPLLLAAAGVGVAIYFGMKSRKG